MDYRCRLSKFYFNPCCTDGFSLICWYNRDETANFCFEVSYAISFRLLAAVWYYFHFLNFNQSEKDKNLHIRVPAKIWKISLVNYQTVHTNSFRVTEFTENKLMQNLEIQTKAAKYFCTFLLRNETENRLLFFRQIYSVQCRSEEHN